MFRQLAKGDVPGQVAFINRRGSIIEGKLVCPHCQYDGSEENGGYFEDVEDALIWRRLDVERGVLRASGPPDVDYDSSCNPRLFCPKCKKYFGVPAGATVIWGAST